MGSDLQHQLSRQQKLDPQNELKTYIADAWTSKATEAKLKMSVAKPWPSNPTDTKLAINLSSDAKAL